SRRDAEAQRKEEKREGKRKGGREGPGRIPPVPSLLILSSFLRASAPLREGFFSSRESRDEVRRAGRPAPPAPRAGASRRGGGRRCRRRPPAPPAGAGSGRGPCCA